MRSRLRVLIPLVLCLAGPAASADSGFWRMRINVVGVDHDGSSTRFSTGDEATLDAGAGLGAAVDWEYRFNERIGLDLGLVAAAEQDLEVGVQLAGGGSGVDGGTLAFVPLTIGVNVHLLPEGPVDLYVGGLAGMVAYGSVDFAIDTGPMGDTQVRARAGTDFTAGAQLGLGVRVGRGGGVFNLSVRQLSTSLETFEFDAGGRTRFDFDPVIYGIGFGFRL